MICEKDHSLELGSEKLEIWEKSWKNIYYKWEELEWNWLVWEWSVELEEEAIDILIKIKDKDIEVIE